MLDHVLDHFIAAYEGNADTDFWSRIVKREWLGSGGDLVTGWILSFVPFSESGEYRLRSRQSILQDHDFGTVDVDNIFAVVEVPVQIDDNGREYDAAFVSGVLGSHVDKKDNKISPALAWALLDKTVPKVTNSSNIRF